MTDLHLAKCSVETCRSAGAAPTYTTTPPFRGWGVVKCCLPRPKVSVSEVQANGLPASPNSSPAIQYSIAGRAPGSFMHAINERAHR